MKAHVHLYENGVMACNKNIGGASGWKHSNEVESVTCKKCLAEIHRGRQTSLELKSKFIITHLIKIRDVVEAMDQEQALKIFRARYPAARASKLLDIRKLGDEKG